ncbi:DNA cytosine methyltransferase [Demequina sp. TTPB684]|uniref:DNA cytosine methyltransferase n=1 Tax=unclassified Demequina TaxID=2620311 RepID=UPI001CF26ACF|nr:MULTISPECIES: DNA cytosine methyltransferase [unclassified Demequina]MCB2413470.1 DNA cytosine methyltransferase [Demequina sp. TTPB684]UPU88773.1 DNA cytosine methyltransferase [Demequina sp. TMPB413]
MDTATLTSIDLFAGAGGLSQGLKEAGFRGVYANELVPRYAETYKLNHPEVWVDSRDIRSVDAHAVRTELGLAEGELDLIAGGPPCQGFSINAPVRSGDDDRNHLFRQYLRFVEEFRPRAVVIENVPGLVSFEGGATLDAILASLRDLGYGADVQILYAPHHGVPQTRWRTVVVGLRGSTDDAVVFPDPTRDAPIRVNFTSNHGGRKLVRLPTSVELPAHVSVRDAIGDLPPLANGESWREGGDYSTLPQNDYQRVLRAGSLGVYNHGAPRLGNVNLSRLQHIPAGGNWTSIPVELLPKGMKRARRSDHTKRYGRVDPNGLASTILTKCDPHWGAYFHYDQDRSFTVREAARIQSFPDSYRFVGSRVEQYEQVGNAVPPLLGAAIGRTVAKSLGDASGEILMAV